MNRYYLVIDGRRKGPFALDELQAQGLERDSLVWCPGLDEWSPADQVPALHEVVAMLPPPLPDYLVAGCASSSDFRDSNEVQSYPPSGFERLTRWWMFCAATAVPMALFGVVCFILVDIRYFRLGRGYSDVEELLEMLASLSLVLAGILLIAAVVLFAILLYMMWSVIQDRQARTTPDKAVGFLFIPFFNVYWVFIAVNGLAFDLRSYVRRHRAGMDAEPAPTQLSLLFCILFACTVVPYVGMITLLPTLVVWFLLVPRLKNCVVAILQVRHAAEKNLQLAADADAEGTRAPLAGAYTAEVSRT